VEEFIVNRKRLLQDVEFAGRKQETQAWQCQHIRRRLEYLPFAIAGCRCTVKPSPTSTMVDVITPIWQRVLQLSSIGIDDNFFDLGGDSVSALELFNEIARACGRDLPPVMIYHAPTIATLAALLEQPEELRFPPLVLLKSGIEEPPIFITHGLGGSVIDFYQVVKHIQLPHAIHGMQAKGIDGVEEPFERIEDMAQCYLEAMKEVQPRGPYILIGYSLGGLVTLEMAQRLTANGEKVALLAMLDTYPYARYLSVGQRLRLGARSLKRRASAVGQLPMRQVLSYLFRASARPLLISSDRYHPPAGVVLSPAMQRVRDGAYLALTRYQPRFYPGRIKFLRAEISTEFPDDPAAVWGKLANEFEVETVPGDHLGIMTTHFDRLAAALSGYVREALCQK
jgi:acetoacetyl-CoA synthetase